jgi:hypothetical protein
MRDDRPAPAELPLPRVKLPAFEPPTPEEIARRRALFAKVMALRDEIGPIGVLADELVREGRPGIDDSRG